MPKVKAEDVEKDNPNIYLNTDPVEWAEEEASENGIDAFVQPAGRLLTEEPDMCMEYHRLVDTIAFWSM